jgi:hypothetical protein
MAALQAQENEIASNFVVFLFSGFLLLSDLVLCFALTIARWPDISVQVWGLLSKMFETWNFLE